MSRSIRHRFPACGTFACADGLVTLGIVNEDQFWRDLCSFLGLDAAARAGDGPALRSLVSSRIERRRRGDLVAVLLAAGVPVAPAITRTEALTVDHFAARGTIADAVIGHPVRFG